jgi:hypothetical protein
MRLKTIVCGMLIGLMLLTSTVPGADNPASQSSGVTEEEKVQFQQKGVGAMMEELQERMFRLAEMIRAAEPEDSAKLLMAVRRAREQLIVEQIKDVVAQLGNQDLGKATEEQKQILLKLEELKKLLLSTEMDLAMQIARLRQLQAAIKKLDESINEEKRQEVRTGEMAQSAKTDPKNLNDARKEQEQNRAITDAVTQMAKDLAQYGTKAVPNLQAGSESMSKAEASLGSSQAKDAQARQGQAIASLQKAKSDLEDARQQLLQEIEKQVKAQVMENLMAMLEQQKVVSSATEALGSKIDSNDRELVLRVRQLAKPEQRVATLTAQTTQLIEETQFSIALPPILQNIERRCLYVMADLGGGQAGTEVVAVQKQIEQDIQELLDTFKNSFVKPSEGNSQCSSCNGNKNKLLAELKVLRLLQARINQETLNGDRLRGLAAQLSQDLREKIIKTGDLQEQVQQAMQKLHHMTCPDCLNED